MPLPISPILFPKFPNSLIGPNDQIELPKGSREIDYEGELAVVIGTRCKDVTEQQALSYVCGYSAFNDVTARDLQFQTSQWLPGKAIDTFGPMGPGIVLAEEVGDPQSLNMTTRVNGVPMQQSKTSEMIFSVAYTISFISSFMTLVPGDIIATGTPAGVGFIRKPPVFLKEGDVVEVEIERIGSLRNLVVATAPAAGRTVPESRR